jgi:hypothetical protein
MIRYRRPAGKHSRHWRHVKAQTIMRPWPPRSRICSSPISAAYTLSISFHPVWFPIFDGIPARYDAEIANSSCRLGRLPARSAFFGQALRLQSRRLFTGGAAIGEIFDHRLGAILRAFLLLEARFRPLAGIFRLGRQRRLLLHNRTGVIAPARHLYRHRTREFVPFGTGLCLRRGSKAVTFDPIIVLFQLLNQGSDAMTAPRPAPLFLPARTHKSNCKIRTSP